MPNARRHAVSNMLPIAIGTLLFATVAGLAFGGWMTKGETLFFAMIQSGLAWCF